MFLRMVGEYKPLSLSTVFTEYRVWPSYAIKPYFQIHKKEVVNKVHNELRYETELKKKKSFNPFPHNDTF